MPAILALDEEECSRGCGRPRASSGRNTWCRPCKNEWQREHRAGRRRFRRVPPPVEDEDGCLLYQGYITKNGYGRRTIHGVSQFAHRAAYELQIGPIPEALVIDHLCRKRSCVNVLHMEVVTLAENTRRGVFRAIADRKRAIEDRKRVA